MPIGCADTRVAENAAIIRHMLEPSRHLEPPLWVTGRRSLGGGNGSFGATPAIACDRNRAPATGRTGISQAFHPDRRSRQKHARRKAWAPKVTFNRGRGSSQKLLGALAIWQSAVRVHRARWV